MTPQAVIAGRIVDQEGFPVEGADVRALTALQGVGKVHRVEVRGGRSNDRGEYRIAGLHAGRYYVEVTRAGNAADWHGPYLAQFYPSSVSLEEATPIEMKAGEERGDVHFRLVRREGATVSGRVEWAAGIDPETNGISVMLSSEDYPGQAWHSGYTNPDGSFRFPPVAPGNYRVIARVFNRGDGKSVAKGTQAVAAGSSGVSGVVVTVLALTPRDFSGRVEMPAGETRRPEKISLQAMDGTIYWGAIDAGGAFTVKNVPPDDYYSVHAMLPVVNGHGGESPISLTAGGKQIEGNNLAVEDGLAEPIVVRVQSAEPGKAEFNLRLTNPAGVPVAGGVVLLQGTVKEHRMAFPVDLRGVQEHLLIEPDDYRVYAMEEMDSPAVWDDPEYMATHLTSATPVHLSAGKNAPLAITLRAP